MKKKEDRERERVNGSKEKYVSDKRSVANVAKDLSPSWRCYIPRYSFPERKRELVIKFAISQTAKL